MAEPDARWWRCAACGERVTGEYSDAASDKHNETAAAKHAALRGAWEDARPDYAQGIRDGQRDEGDDGS
jgi:hypothetical protein